MNKKILEMIVVGSVLIGTATFVPNAVYAQKVETKEIQSQQYVGPKLVKKEIPVYPESLKQKGIEGRAYVHTDIDTYGNPVAARISKSSGNLELDSLAVETIMDGFKFKPAMRDKHTVASNVIIPFELKLSDNNSNENISYIDYDAPPQVIKRVEPTYPNKLRQRGIEGTSYVHAHIDAYGVPTSVHISKPSGYMEFDSAALISARQFRFQPPQTEGGHSRGIASEVIIPFEYKLK